MGKGERGGGEGRGERGDCIKRYLSDIFSQGRLGSISHLGRSIRGLRPGASTPFQSSNPRAVDGTLTSSY